MCAYILMCVCRYLCCLLLYLVAELQYEARLTISNAFSGPVVGDHEVEACCEVMMLVGASVVTI